MTPAVTDANEQDIMKFARHISLLLTALVIAFSASAQTEMSKKERKNALKSITSTYRTWNSVQIDGKVQTDLIPLSITAKIYMENDQLIDISLRAPFVGEAARVVLTQDSILAINKIKRTYACESITHLMSVLPVGMCDLQDILLARVFVAGKGEISSRNADDCQMLMADGGNCIIVPPAIAAPQVDYGFTTSGDGKLLQFMAFYPGKELSFESEFSYDFNQTSIFGSLVRNGRNVTATLTYPDPNFKPSAPKEASVGKNYQKVSLRQVMKF